MTELEAVEHMVANLREVWYTMPSVYQNSTNLMLKTALTMLLKQWDLYQEELVKEGYLNARHDIKR